MKKPEGKWEDLDWQDRQVVNALEEVDRIRKTLAKDLGEGDVAQWAWTAKRLCKKTERLWQACTPEHLGLMSFPEALAYLYAKGGIPENIQEQEINPGSVYAGLGGFIREWTIDGKVIRMDDRMVGIDHRTREVRVDGQVVIDAGYRF